MKYFLIIPYAWNTHNSLQSSKKFSKLVFLLKSSKQYIPIEICHAVNITEERYRKRWEFHALACFNLKIYIFSAYLRVKFPVKFWKLGIHSWAFPSWIKLANAVPTSFTNTNPHQLNSYLEKSLVFFKTYFMIINCRRAIVRFFEFRLNSS